MRPRALPAALLPAALLAGAPRAGALPVRVLVWALGESRVLPGAKVTIFAQSPYFGVNTSFDAVAGADGTFVWEDDSAGPDQRITAISTLDGYHETQTGTVQNTDGHSMDAPLSEVAVQMVPDAVYSVFLNTVPMPWARPLNASQCVFIATVCRNDSTVRDSAQGEPGAVATLLRGGAEVPLRPFYFDHNPWLNITNPWAEGRTTTSRDGGVVFANVPPSDDPYTVRATKPGVAFSDAEMRCGATRTLLVNAAPNEGPRAGGLLDGWETRTFTAPDGRAESYEGYSFAVQSGAARPVRFERIAFTMHESPCMPACLCGGNQEYSIAVTCDGKEDWLFLQREVPDKAVVNEAGDGATLVCGTLSVTIANANEACDEEYSAITVVTTVGPL